MSRRTTTHQGKPKHASDRLADLMGYHLRRASIFDLQGAVSMLETIDMRPIPLSVLLCIVEKPGVTSAEICRALGMKSANIVSILADFEERGLFLRDADAADQRIQRLFPTRGGEEAAQEGLALILEHEDHLLRRLTESERTELRRLLALIWLEEQTV